MVVPAATKPLLMLLLWQSLLVKPTLSLLAQVEAGAHYLKIVAQLEVPHNLVQLLPLEVAAVVTAAVLED